MLAFVMAVTLILPLSQNEASAYDDYPGYDNWGFVPGQCTSFAAWCVNSRNNVGFSCYYNGVFFGNAGDWGAAARAAGLTVDMNPAVGCVMWQAPNEYGAGAYGHVGWVSAVNGSQVTIEEYNWGYPPESYNQRVIDKSQASGYIHFSYPYNQKISVTGLSMKNDYIDIKTGEKCVVNAQVSPSNATNRTIYYSSNNTAVATVSSSGVVTGVSEGYAKITAKTADGGYWDDMIVNVTRELPDLTVYTGRNNGSSWEKVKGVDLTLFCSNSSSYATRSLTGTGIFADIPEGDHTLMVTKSGYAPRYYSVSVGSANTAVKVSLTQIGDISDDGRINSTDILYSIAFTKQLIRPHGYTEKVADYNNDGQVNTTDTLYIIRAAQ